MQRFSVCLAEGMSQAGANAAFLKFHLIEALCRLEGPLSQHYLFTFAYSPETSVH